MACPPFLVHWAHGSNPALRASSAQLQLRSHSGSAPGSGIVGSVRRWHWMVLGIAVSAVCLLTGRHGRCTSVARYYAPLMRVDGCSYPSQLGPSPRCAAVFQLTPSSSEYIDRRSLSGVGGLSSCLRYCPAPTTGLWLCLAAESGLSRDLQAFICRCTAGASLTRQKDNRQSPQLTGYRTDVDFGAPVPLSSAVVAFDCRHRPSSESIW